MMHEIESKLLLIFSRDPLPKDKKKNDWFKLKAFADDKINVTENLKFVLEKV